METNTRGCFIKRFVSSSSHLLLGKIEQLGTQRPRWHPPGQGRGRGCPRLGLHSPAAPRIQWESTVGKEQSSEKTREDCLVRRAGLQGARFVGGKPHVCLSGEFRAKGCVQRLSGRCPLPWRAVLCGQSGLAGVGRTPEGGLPDRGVDGLRGWVRWPREGEASSGLSCPGLPPDLLSGEGGHEVSGGDRLLPALPSPSVSVPPVARLRAAERAPRPTPVSASPTG